MNQNQTSVNSSSPVGETPQYAPYRHHCWVPSNISKLMGYLPGFQRLASGKLLIEKDISQLFGANAYITTKQVPTCLTLRKTGQQSLMTVGGLTPALELAFPLIGCKGGKWEKISYQPTDEVIINESASGSYLTRTGEFKKIGSTKSYDVESEHSRARKFRPVSEESPEFEIDSNLASSIIEEYTSIKIDADDAFNVIRASAIADMIGEQPPKVLEWTADLKRLTDPIPSVLLQKGGYRGKGQIEFARIADPELREYVIQHHTYWGNTLYTLANDANSEFKEFASKTLKRVKAFLRGEDDPLTKVRHLEVISARKSERNIQTRCERLIECLKTVDGIFIQRFIAFPEEKWTWHRYDMFILGNLSVLITDEFLDGVLTQDGLSIVTNYAKLKKFRKFIKLEGHLDRKSLTLIPRDQWLNQYSGLLHQYGFKEGADKVRTLAILSQTRGCGTPPPLVVLQSKIQFLETVSTKPPPLTKSTRALVKLSMNSLLREIPDEALTGMATAARINVTTSACFEYGVAENGTAQAINDMVYEANGGRRVYRLDLNTGKRLDTIDIGSSTTGEYIFWRSLEEVLAMPLEDLRELKLVMVREPGKARTVSKGHACLKIVLDVVNKLMSKPFGKAFPSSASGMEKSNHGWNVYKGMFSGPLAQIVFLEKNSEVSETSDGELRHIEWEELFASSTDFDTATDFFNHEIGEILGNGLMLKVGIPPILRGIVNSVSFRPRSIQFAASGELDRFGKKVDEHNRSIQIVTGIMMGDPLTKILLHMVNMCIRRTSELLKSPGGIQNEAAIANSFRKPIYG